jgi:hypothetical protein
MDSERVWLETRPVGALLSELKELNGTEVAILFEEVLEALVSLEAVGLRHGELCAERVVVSDKGRPVLIGRGGEEASDLEAVISMILAVWPKGEVPLFEQVPDSLESLWKELRDLLGAQASEPVHSGLARRVQSLRQGLPEPARPIRIRVDDQAEVLDEVSVDLGPEPASRGLFGPWNTNTGTTGNTALTGFSDSSREWTMADAGPGVDAHQSLLAQLVSMERCEADPARFQGREESVAMAIRSELATEPLQALALGLGIKTPSLKVEVVEAKKGPSPLLYPLLLGLLGAGLAYFLIL